MPKSLRSQSPVAVHYVSTTLLSLILLATPTIVFAHAGHGIQIDCDRSLETPQKLSSLFPVPCYICATRKTITSISV